MLKRAESSDRMCSEMFQTQLHKNSKEKHHAGLPEKIIWHQIFKNVYNKPGDSMSWESPEKENNVLSVIYSNIVPLIIKTFTKYLKTHASE